MLMAMLCLFKAEASRQEEAPPPPCADLGLVEASSASLDPAGATLLSLWVWGGTGEVWLTVEVMSGDPLTDPLPAMTVTGDPLLEDHEDPPACVILGEAERARLSWPRRNGEERWRDRSRSCTMRACSSRSISISFRTSVGRGDGNDSTNPPPAPPRELSPPRPLPVSEGSRHGLGLSLPSEGVGLMLVVVVVVVVVAKP